MVVSVDQHLQACLWPKGCAQGCKEVVNAGRGAILDRLLTMGHCPADVIAAAGISRHCVAPMWRHYMTVLILGLALWWLPHLFKRLAPGPRGRMGDPAKGLVSVLVLISVVLMVLGYRAAEFYPVWTPPAFLIHLNNLLMMLAFYLFVASGLQTRITRIIRHPQLTGVKTWAVAHLLVNGDLAAIVLFGGMLAWAVVSVILINRAAREWVPPPVAAAGREVLAVVITLVVVGLVMVAHNWLGVQPWG
jgi:uncharacterized membrane protein